MKLIVIGLIALCGLWFWAGNGAYNAATSASASKEVMVRDTLAFGVDVERPLAGKKIIAILGSSRPKPGSPLYELASKVAEKLASNGFGIVTGGGPGVMDAANQAAFAAHVPSIGFDTAGFWARQPTTYMDHLFVFKDLQVRKRELMQVAQAFVFIPGGLGTLDEVFTVVGAIYSDQLKKKPVILVDRKFWTPLMGYIRATLINDYKTVDDKSLEEISIVGTPDEVLKLVQ